MDVRSNLRNEYSQFLSFYEAREYLPIVVQAVTVLVLQFSIIPVWIRNERERENKEGEDNKLDLWSKAQAWPMASSRDVFLRKFIPFCSKKNVGKDRFWSYGILTGSKFSLKYSGNSVSLRNSWRFYLFIFYFILFIWYLWICSFFILFFYRWSFDFPWKFVFSFSCGKWTTWKFEQRFYDYGNRTSVMGHHANSLFSRYWEGTRERNWNTSLWENGPALENLQFNILARCKHEWGLLVRVWGSHYYGAYRIAYDATTNQSFQRN